MLRPEPFILAGAMRREARHQTRATGAADDLAERPIGCAHRSADGDLRVARSAPIGQALAATNPRKALR
jgi:hypothetical protein